MGWVPELLRRAARGPVAASLFSAVLVALLIAEFVRPRQEVAPTEPNEAPTEQEGVPAPVVLEPTGRVTLGRPLAADEQLVVDRSAKGDSALLGASVNETRVTISPLAPGGGSGLSTSLSFDTQVPARAVQIGALGGKPVAFAIGSRGATAVVETHDLLGGGSLLERVDSRPIKRARGSSRDARIATWSGSEPDLFLLDRGVSERTLAVRVLSGESDYQELLLDVKVARGNGFPPEQWALDVGPVDGDRPDILLVTTGARTATGSTEAHILSGDQRYTRYHIQAASVLQDERPAGRAALGSREGSPTWFSATGGSRLVHPFRLPSRSSGSR